MAKDDIARKKLTYSLIIAAAALLMIFAFCGRFFDNWLKDVANFFVGSFGMAFYGIMIAMIVCFSFALADKKTKVPKKYIVHFALIFVEIVLFVHMCSTQFIYGTCDTFGEYIDYVYHYYTGIPTIGGVVFGMIVYGLQRVTTIWGASVLLLGLLAWSVITTGDFFYCYYTGKLQLKSQPKHPAQSSQPSSDIETSAPVASEVAQPAEENREDDERSRAYDILFTPSAQPTKPENDPFELFGLAPQSKLDTDDDEKGKATPSREQAVDILFNNGDGNVSSSAPSLDDLFKDVKNNAAQNNVSKNNVGSVQNGDADQSDTNGFFDRSKNSEKQHDVLPWRISSASTENNASETIEAEKSEQHQTAERTSFVASDSAKTQSSAHPAKTRPVITEDAKGGEWITSVEVGDEADDEIDVTDVFVDEPTVQTEPIVRVQPSEQIVEAQPTEPIAEAQPTESIAETQPTEPEKSENAAEDDTESADVSEINTDGDQSELVAVQSGRAVPGGIQVGYDFQTKDDVRKAQEQIHKYPKYVKPPYDLLEEAVEVADTEQEYRERSAQEIVKKLSVFGIKVQSEGQVVGPSVTRYAFKVLSERTKMSDFKQYSPDIKACLEASNDIIIQAPIAGTNMVGIEVPNKVVRTVKLRNLLESKEFQQSSAKLAFIIGQEITGEILVGDLSKLPHLLVAGTTGSGKSVFLDSMIISLMYKYGPEYLRFIMVDPKLVELSRFNGIPHMLTNETVTNATDALASMDYLIAEMESRYQLFKQNGVVNIVGYNAKINPQIQQRLPYLVLVVDELSDLMSVCQKQFEAKLLRLAQKSRAAGIHMVLATQRPDVKTITGTIKTNFSCRVALKVAAPQDSMTILSTGGAEKLLGRGDMLYLGEGQAAPTRAQGTFVNDDEIEHFVQYVKESNEAFFDENISKQIFASEQPVEEETKEAPDAQEEKLDPYCKKALRFWLERQNGRASIASIQRSLKIGFNRAGRIMDTLQRLHYVEEIPSNETSSRPVTVLVTLDELDNLFPDMED